MTKKPVKLFELKDCGHAIHVVEADDYSTREGTLVLFLNNKVVAMFPAYVCFTIYPK